MDISIGSYSGAFDVETSSHRRNRDKSISVDGYCAVDGDINTAWNSNNKIAGEWIRLSIPDGRFYEVAGLRLANGYWKNNSVYRKNTRIKTADVYCEDRYVTTFRLVDSVDYQTVMFDKPVLCSSVEIRIRDGYKGSSYKDCGLTEIDLIGRMGQTLSSDAINDWGRVV